MNKTININLGGYFFHIDESAYQKLRRYLDAIARSLSDDPQGKNEIIADIEARISELLSEKITDARQVVNEQDISEIIKVMGEPEDYAESEEGYATSGNTYQRKSNNSKRLFRDGDDKFLGGVAAGVAHYLDLDVIWVRLAFLLLGIFTGIGILAYIILWILLPEAKTTAEKLQMEGEAVNIDNIEKKIREELGAVTETIKDGATEVTKKVNEGVKKGAKSARSGFQDFLDTLGKIILSIFKVFGKFIGVIIIITSASVLVSFIVALFSIGSIEIFGWEYDYINLPFGIENTLLPHWLIATCVFILVGFPFLILFILGLRILSNRVKQLSKTTSLSLLGIWIVALLLLIFSAVEYGTANAINGNHVETKKVNLVSSDTLTLKMVNDENIHYVSRLRRSTKRTEVTHNDRSKTYSNYVKLDVNKSDSDEAYLKIRKSSEGRNKRKANSNAEALEYNYTIDGNTMTFDAFFLSNFLDKYKREVVNLTLYIPEGKTVYFDKSTSNFLHGIYDVDHRFDSDMPEHYFLMTSEGLDCTDCDEIEDKTELEEEL